VNQTAGANADAIDRCLMKLPLGFWESTTTPKRRNRKAVRSWVCSRKEVYRKLSKFGKAHEKYIPRELLRLSQRQSRVFLDALTLGDGSGAEQGKWSYYTASPQLADDVQELALRCGLAADIAVVDRTNQRGYDHPEYTVRIKVKRLRPESRHEPAKVPYRGKVYCVTVPNGLLYVRRDGKATWCGNSDWGEFGLCIMKPEYLAWEKTGDLWVPTMGMTF